MLEPRRPELRAHQLIAARNEEGFGDVFPPLPASLLGRVDEVEQVEEESVAPRDETRTESAQNQRGRRCHSVDLSYCFVAGRTGLESGESPNTPKICHVQPSDEPSEDQATQRNMVERGQPDRTPDRALAASVRRLLSKARLLARVADGDARVLADDLVDGLDALTSELEGEGADVVDLASRRRS